MSIDSAKNFLDKIQADAQFKQSIEDAADDDARRQLVKGAGFEFTKDELKEAAKGLSKQELNEDELESVAGGSSAAWTGAAAGVVGAGCAAAAL
jgi:predicted ribosomally synthesized peptide with nif11-like leader